MSKPDDSLIEIGDRVKDRVSGFHGVVVAETTWFNGCRRFNVRSEEIAEGAKIADATEPVAFDEEELVLVRKNVMSCKGRTRLSEERQVTLVKKHTGGPMPTAKIL